MALNEHPFEPSEGTIGAVHEAANEADAAGLCFIPPAEDGTKRPMPDPSGRWDRYKTARPTAEEKQQWYPGRTGIGVVTGTVSGQVETWDFNDRDTYERLVAAAKHCGLGAVVDRIEDGYCDDTPGNGVRWLVRYPAEVERRPGDKIILARRPKGPEERKHPNDKIKMLIELPPFSIVAPSNGRVHPSGKPYFRRMGGFSTIASYTMAEREALMELARSFDAMLRREAASMRQEQERAGRPGDDYSTRTSWSEVLGGWTNVYTRDGTTYWRRPGKDIGISATTNFGGADLLYVFSSSTEFEAEKSYNRFGSYAVLNHGGDFHAAARALAQQGYGQKPAPNSEPTLNQVGDYRETKLGIDWLRRTKDGEGWVPLTNFHARIVSGVTRDDGVETTGVLEIEGLINGRSHAFSVNAAQFSQMTWPLEHLGPEAVVQPGQGSKDRARFAIQVLSGRIPRRRVYTHTGWRNIDGTNVYLHGGGALGADGPVDGLEVELPEQLERYALPVADDNLRDPVAASLAMRNVAPDRVTVPLLGAAYRTVIGGADFSLHISGPTGVQKSEIAALAQQHFGAAMDARALPASWSSTVNSLEAIASAAKDALLVIDDYVPQGTTADRMRLNAQADRVLRAQGNHSGRGRLRSDATMRRTRPPRGLIASTGEEVPGGQSLRARIVIVEVQRGDVKLEVLTLAQRDALQGIYAKAMAGFIRWLAPRLDQVRTDLASISRERRTKLGGVHARTADSLAQLSAAWTIWLRFVVEVGVATREEADAIECEVWSTLTALATEQHALQRASDPVERFYELLVAVLSSGKGHISSAESPDRKPEDAVDANALGWRRSIDDLAWYSQGPCIGWWADDGIYLEPEAAYAAAQQLGGSGGEGISVASTTLYRRMHERGLLLSVERRGGETRLKPRKSIGGKRRAILHINHTLSPYPAQGGPTGPSGHGEQERQRHNEVA